MPLVAAHRNHPAWWAFAAHRLSGLTLALFLPLHFLALGLAVNESLFDAFLAWTRHPFLIATETALVLSLVVHLVGGLRLLLSESWPWRR
jgi:fumarate reductase subunit D